MIDALTTATAGMSAASAQAAAAAGAIATPSPAAPVTQSGSNGVLGGTRSLPPDSLDALTSLMSAELSFKANAFVARTAVEMIEALYRAVDEV